MLEADRSSFPLVMERNRKRGGEAIRRAAEHSPAWFVAFDLLCRDGETLTGKPLVERRRALDDLLPEGRERMFANPFLVGAGKRSSPPCASGRWRGWSPSASAAPTGSANGATTG